MVSANVQKFQEAADEIASSLKARLSGDIRVKINTHTDPDGISSGNILARCLDYFDVPFHISFGSPPEREDLKKLRDQDYDLFVFVDQGTGQFPIIDEFLLDSGQEVLILDHHPGEVMDRPNLTFLNPHKFGLSGSKDVSASGVVYSVVEKIDDSFETLSELALIGALGDRQEGPSGFSGVNREIFEKAVKRDILTSSSGLKLAGRSVPVVDCLAGSTRPFLLGLSGDREGSRDLIEELGFNPESTLEDMDLEEEENLKEDIMERVNVDPSGKFENSLWGKIYRSKVDQTAGPKNAHEYVTLLDSCEKLGQIGIGFSAMLGDQDSGEKAQELLQKYQEEMIETMKWLVSEEELIKATSRMRYIDFEDKLKSKVVGEVLSVAIESGLIETDLPLLGMAHSDEGVLKISARATADYAESGADLGEVLEKVSKELDGGGGGHNVAAAARIPIERKDEFLTRVDKVFENMS